jgi:hypothetical protein
VTGIGQRYDLPVGRRIQRRQGGGQIVVDFPVQFALNQEQRQGGLAQYAGVVIAGNVLGNQAQRILGCLAIE